MSDRRYEDLTERQQRACHVISRKFGVDLADVPPRFDALMRLLQGEITILEAESLTDLVIVDHTHPTLF